MDQGGGHAVTGGGGGDQVVVRRPARGAAEQSVPQTGFGRFVFRGDAQRRIAAGDGFHPVDGFDAGQAVEGVARQPAGQRFGGQGGGVGDEAVGGGGFDPGHSHLIRQARPDRQRPEQQRVNPRQAAQHRQRQQQHPAQHRPQRHPQRMPALAQELPRMGALRGAGQGQIDRHQDGHHEHPDQEIGRGDAQHRSLGVGLEAGGGGHGGTEERDYLRHGDIARCRQKRRHLVPKRGLAARRRLGAGGGGDEPPSDGPPWVSKGSKIHQVSRRAAWGFK